MDMEMETNSHRLVASRGRLLLADLLVCLSQIELLCNEKDLHYLITKKWIKSCS